VPSPQPHATPSGGAAKVSSAAAMGGSMAPQRGRRCRRPLDGRRRGGRPGLQKSQRRDGDPAVAAATALMGTPVEAAATAMAAPAAGRSVSGAAHPSGGRAAPGARPPPRPPRHGRRRLRRPYGSGGCVSDGGSCTWRQIDGAFAPPPQKSLQPPPPPRSPLWSPPRPPPPRLRPPLAAACGCASCARSSTAHDRVGGRRGKNTASGGRHRPHSPHAGVAGAGATTKTASPLAPTQPLI